MEGARVSEFFFTQSPNLKKTCFFFFFFFGGGGGVGRVFTMNPTLKLKKKFFFGGGGGWGVWGRG